MLVKELGRLDAMGLLKIATLVIGPDGAVSFVTSFDITQRFEVMPVKLKHVFDGVELTCEGRELRAIMVPIDAGLPFFDFGRSGGDNGEARRSTP